jgi:ribosomal protein L11 methyltransferase
MSWLEIRLDATPEAIDWVCTLLAAELDPQNIQITNYLKPNLEPDLEPNLESYAASDPELDNLAAEPLNLLEVWAFTMLLYFPNDARSRTRLDHLEKILSPLYRTGLTGEMQMSIIPTKPQLFSHFQQPVGSKFLVSMGTTPLEQSQISNQQLSSNQSPKSLPIPLYLNPSLTFGSGLHPATIVSLQMLERYVSPGMRVLDLGSGSGILSVASAKLGAQVLALDNDPIAVEATQGAIELNQVQSQVIAQAGSLGQGSNLGHWLGETVGEVAQIEVQGESLSLAEGKFDLIIANIFARIHCTLALDYYQALHHSGKGLLIMAGFTIDQEADVTAACEQVGFKFLDRLCQNQGDNQWVALIYAKTVNSKQFYDKFP